ncbi:MAG: STAS domain-containing protein, partial [Rubrivivax sp.]
AGAGAAFALPARVTLEEATTVLRGLEAALEAAPPGGGALHIDAAGVVELDTAAVALLLQARRLARARGLGFTLTGAPDALRALADLYGVESLIDGAGLAGPPSSAAGPRADASTT